MNSALERSIASFYAGTPRRDEIVLAASQKILTLSRDLVNRGADGVLLAKIQCAIDDVIRDFLEELALGSAASDSYGAPNDTVSERSIVPEGYVLMPKEPSMVMQAGGAQAIRFDTTVLNKICTANAVYRAMVAEEIEEAAAMAKLTF